MTLNTATVYNTMRHAKRESWSDVKAVMGTPNNEHPRSKKISTE